MDSYLAGTTLYYRKRSLNLGVLLAAPATFFPWGSGGRSITRTYMTVYACERCSLGNLIGKQKPCFHSTSQALTTERKMVLESTKYRDKPSSSKPECKAKTEALIILAHLLVLKKKCAVNILSLFNICWLKHMIMLMKSISGASTQIFYHF